ncbi:GNAT family N-acetyltransferase [Aggregicoccus sp. 17bor-14]|uniref:GNAT family N-acetyltransferase n=1 Tax=Myxococcaceae TaxID=31 RepID=UPI00129C37D7|nr:MULTISPECIES: GNAT family N-acetyltransferase [Myxococcaceae]MBF5044853.1 GNAT family N-acetyltransferase [Simulacricoccus sp. 17bor-14]MRI90597.1 GNAT family N-acetyltransferase [Aggregicoccus sp. 17bor-14]
MSDWSRVPVLEGRHVRLEPLQPSHVQGLQTAVSDGELWTCWYTKVPRPEAMAAYVESALGMQARGEALPFVVRDAGGAVVGSTRLYALDPRTPRLTIGYTWYAQRVQRTGLNTEAKLLLLGHAFEALGCIAVAFETSWFNHASRAAIERLGAKQDGVLRSHQRHDDGSVRDTVVFSILAAEWPAVRSHLRAKLAAHA